MNTRAALLFAAVIFLGFGGWMTWEGWQKKWKAKGIAYRAGGAVVLIAGAYTAATAVRK
jgi:hypothetical protein